MASTCSRKLGRWLALAALLAGAWGLNLLLYSKTAAEAVAFLKLSLFVVVLVTGCGVSVGRLAGLDLRSPRQAALAPTLGLLYLELAWFFSMWLARNWLFWPLVLVPVVPAIVLWRRKKGLAPAKPGEPTWDGLLHFTWAKAAIGLILVLWLGLTLPRVCYRELTEAPQGLRTVTPYVDQASYLANAAMIKQAVPPQNPDLAGVPSTFHYFGDMIVAMLSSETGTELILAYRFVFPLLLVLLLAAVISVAWSFCRDEWSVFWIAAIALFGGDFSIYSSQVLEHPRGILGDVKLYGELYFRRHFWGNPAFSWLNNLPQLAGTVVSLVALELALLHRERGGAGRLVAAAAVMATILKFKSPLFFVMMAGLALGGLAEVWRERRFHLLSIAGLAAVMAAPALAAMYGAEGRPSLQFQFLPYFREFARPVSGPEAAGLPLAVAVSASVVGFLGLRLFAFLPGRAERLSVEDVLLYGAAGAGLVLFFFAVEPADLRDAFNTVWPARLSLTLLSIPAGAWLARCLAARGAWGTAVKAGALFVTAPVLLGAVVLLWVYPSIRPSFVHPQVVSAFRYVRAHGLSGTSILSYRRKIYAPGLCEHPFYVAIEAPLAYTRRLRAHHERMAEIDLPVRPGVTETEADAWLQRNRIEFVFTPAERPAPRGLERVMSGAYGTLWRARWALRIDRAEAARTPLLSGDGGMEVLKLGSVADDRIPPGVIRLDYRSGVDRREDWALLWPPEQGSTWVVMVHGHGSHGDQLYTRADLRQNWLPLLRGRGLGVLTPNLRDNAWMSPAAAADLSALLAFVRREYVADAFVLASGSMGGTSNVIYAGLRPDDAAAVIALCPACDLRSYYDWCRERNTGVLKEIADAIEQSYGGSPRDVPDLYRLHSAVENAPRLTMPVYLCHATGDALIPVSESQHLAAALRTRPGFTYVEIAGGHHDTPLDPVYLENALDWVLARMNRR